MNDYDKHTKKELISIIFNRDKLISKTALSNEKVILTAKKQIVTINNMKNEIANIETETRRWHDSVKEREAECRRLRNIISDKDGLIERSLSENELLRVLIAQHKNTIKTMGKHIGTDSQ